MGKDIFILVKNPSVNSFTEFIKNLIKILKEYKKSNND